jgi:hypothetical protein
MPLEDLMNLFTGIAGVGAVASGVGAYNKSVADRAAYQIQSTVAGQNAAIADLQAQDAIRRGQVTEFNSTLKARQLKGQQIAQMAGGGLDLSSGSPTNILTDTDLMSAADAAVIRGNAMKEAWGYKVQEANYKSNADILKMRADMESPLASGATSLLTGAGRVASSWYNSRRAGSGVNPGGD